MSEQKIGGLGLSAEAVVEALPTLAEVQDVDVNYYVLVPFTTVAAAEWAAGEIGMNFDCHVVSTAAVDQHALVYSTETAEQSSQEVWTWVEKP